MADRATSDRVAADMKPPEYRQAVQRLRGIVAKKSKIGEINGDISDIYAKVEGHKVNKKAARIFLTLDGLEQQDREDIMRSLNGLIDAAEWGAPTTDLVDKAEGKVVQMKLKGRGGAKPAEGENAAGEDEVIDQTMREVEAMGSEPPADPAASGTAAEQSNGFLASVAAQKAAERTLASNKGRKGKTAEPETYTGDNSDLAGGE